MQPEYGALFKIDDVKASDGGFEVAGYVSTFGNVDHGGDVVMRGAFDASIAAWRTGSRKIRFLYAHDTFSPLGVAKDLRADDKGLFGTFKISKTTLGEDVHTWLKDGALDSFSIGYIPTDVEFDDVGVRKLLSVDLLECSVVSIPMNEQAGVTRVKADLPFDQVLVRSLEHLKLGVAEAEALHTRRAAEKRELSERHLAAMKDLADEAEASMSRLRALLVALESESGPVGDMKLRLDLARRLSAYRGHLQETAA